MTAIEGRIDVEGTVAVSSMIEQERDFLDAVIDVAGSLVCVIDPDGRFRRFNRACEIASGYRRADLPDRPFWEYLVPSLEAAAVRTAIDGLRAGEPPTPNENHWVTRDGALRLISWSNACFFAVDGSLSYVISTGVDITDHRRAEAALAGIEEAGDLLAKTGPTSEALDGVLRSLADRMGYRFLALFLAEDGRLRLRARLGYDALEEDFDPGGGVVGRAFRGAVPILVTKVDEDPDYIIGHPAVRSEIAVPLRAEGVTLGVLSIEAAAEAPLDEADLHLVETLAGRLSTALIIGRDQQILGDRARLFVSLNGFARTASGILDSERLWPTLVDAVAKVIPADIVGLTVFEPATGRYVLRAVRGLDEGAIGSEIRPPEGGAGRAIAARQLVVSDALGRVDYADDLRDRIPPDTISSAAVPLIHDGTVIGAITVARRQATLSTFSSTECEILTLLGAQAALALANAALVEEVRALSIRDPLTGLYNRRHFDASFDHIIARWSRARDGRRPVAAIMFDLDHFGRFNKEHGHQAGDAVLRAFSGILQTRFRSADLVARYGGEEFVAILEGSDRAGALTAAEDVRADLAGRAILGPDGQKLRATVSAGCAELDPLEPTREALLRTADVGLFMAKRAGRNQVVAA